MTQSTYQPLHPPAHRVASLSLALRLRRRSRLPGMTVFILLACAVLAPSVWGDTAHNDPVTLLTGQLQSRPGEVLIVFDHERESLAIYSTRSNKLTLLFTRDCGADFQLETLGKQEPVIEGKKEEESKPKAAGDAEPAPKEGKPSTGKGEEPAPAGKKEKEGERKPKAAGDAESAPDEGKPSTGKEGEQPVTATAQGGGHTLVLGNPQGQAAGDHLYVLQHAARRLAIYRIRGAALELLFVRDCGADLDIFQFGRGKPTPREVRERVAKDVAKVKKN